MNTFDPSSEASFEIVPMRLYSPVFLGVGLFAGALVLAGCVSSSVTTDRCVEDGDCPTGQFCDLGTCKCRTDDHCGAGFYCNDYGNCQPRPPCLGNQDCAGSEICNTADPSGGACIPEQECGSNVHCPFNQTCEIVSPAVAGTCVDGCQDSGDCQLGYICRANQCQAGSTPDDCFECSSVPEPDASYCDYGEKCEPSTGLCTAITGVDGLCERCLGQCEADGLACIIDNESCSCIDNKCYPTAAPCTTADDCIHVEECSVNYCAPVCDTDADCPNGYHECDGLITICGVCQTDADCDAQLEGSKCIIGQETDSGICSCTSQDDCESRMCQTKCEGLQNPCNTNDDCLLGGDCVPGGPCTVICWADADCDNLGGTTCTHYCSDFMATCAGDGDCSGGATCLLWGVCEFSGDNPFDCDSHDECLCLDGANGGVCNISGYPCDSADDCRSTFVLFSEDPAVGGYCQTNTKVCGKDTGFLCQELLGEAICRSF